MRADALRRCDPARGVVALTGVALGTTWRVRFVGSTAAAARLRALIDRRLAGIVAEMSQWEPTSLLSAFNLAPAGTAIALPPDFAAVMTAALDVAERSGGAFDPTFGRTAALLGFGAETVATPPSAAALEAARAEAGWRRLDYDRAARTLRQPGGVALDFSGIAKGYAVDAIADLLAAEGLPDALVEIGGELAGRGLRPDGQPWWVDLETPPDAALAPLRLGLHELAVATSGDYVRGAHTIAPATGRPLPAAVTSVSVVHASAMLADAWATALTVLGVEERLAVATQEQLAARIISRDGHAYVETLTPAFAAMLADA